MGPGRSGVENRTHSMSRQQLGIRALQLFVRSHWVKEKGEKAVCFWKIEASPRRHAPSFLREEGTELNMVERNQKFRRLAAACHDRQASKLTQDWGTILELALKKY